MRPRSLAKVTLCALVGASWMAACGDDTSPPSTDASVDGAEDAKTHDGLAIDVRREALASLPGLAGGGNDGGCTPVAATCDGPEDCPSGQTCCGTLDLLAGGYTKIACQSSPCAPADGGAALDAGGTTLVLELCRADTKCHDSMGYVCGTSMYLPPFLYRCNTASTPPPATAVGVPGHVACGTSNCAEGEQCCILGQTGKATQTYCAPQGQPCPCTAPPSDGGSDVAAADAVTDAMPTADAAADVSSVEAGTDAPNAEAAVDASSEAAPQPSDASTDAFGTDAHE